MADTEDLTFDAPHKPNARGREAFAQVIDVIREEVIASRDHWDKHQAEGWDKPKMWSRTEGLSDTQLKNFSVEDLRLIRSAQTPYGPMLLGKIRIPEIKGKPGYIHVRIHDPPGEDVSNVRFHSLFTDEEHDSDGHITATNAIQDEDKPLEFFHE